MQFAHFLCSLVFLHIDVLGYVQVLRGRCISKGKHYRQGNKGRWGSRTSSEQEKDSAVLWEGNNYDQVAIFSVRLELSSWRRGQKRWSREGKEHRKYMK